MLVLTRKTQQQIQIGDQITITIVRVTGQSVRVGIQAPEAVRVIRGELVGKPPRAAELHASGDSVASTASAEPGVAGDEARLPAETHLAPLAARCRSRMSLAGAGPAPAAESHTCATDRRRVPGASSTPLIRRPQRLGPASLGSMCRLR